MNKKTALFISTVFHPVFTNLLSLSLLFVLYPSLAFGVQTGLKLFYTGFIFLTTGILPLLLVILFQLVGLQRSIMLEEKEERNLPYIITASLYLIDFYLAKKAGAPVLLTAYLLAASSVVVVVLIVNQFDKISIHMASMGALTGLVLCSFPGLTDIRYLFIGSVVLSGLVASARMFAESHNARQIACGFLLGLFLMWFIL